MGDKRIQTVKWQVRWDWAASKTRDERALPEPCQEGGGSQKENPEIQNRERSRTIAREE